MGGLSLADTVDITEVDRWWIRYLKWSRENVKCDTPTPPPRRELGIYLLGGLACSVGSRQCPGSACPVLSSALQLSQGLQILFMEIACTRRCGRLPR